MNINGDFGPGEAKNDEKENGAMQIDYDKEM